MRALGSHETAVESRTDTALDRLGKSIAKALGISWIPWLAARAKHTRPLKSLTAKERRAEIKRTYHLTEDYFDFDGKRILLIDDITTTGITLTSIIRLIKQYFPDSRFKYLPWQRQKKKARSMLLSTYRDQDICGKTTQVGGRQSRKQNIMLIRNWYQYPSG